jgi:hypothetical protein
LAFGLTFAGCVALVGTQLDRWEISPGKLHLEKIVLIRNWQDAIQSLEQRRGSTLVLMLGDSMIDSSVHMRDPRREALPERLELELHRSRPGGRVRIAPLRWPAFGPFDAYFLADEIAATDTEYVIVCFNFRSLSERWQAARTRRELAGWLAPDRIGEALRLPLHEVGLSPDRLLLYQAAKHSGEFDAWYGLRREQSRVQRLLGKAREFLAGQGAINPYLAFRDVVRFENLRSRRRPGSRPETSSEYLETLYGAVLSGVTPDHPVMQVLEASLRRFHDAGMQTLLVALPLNVELLQLDGMLDQRRGLETTLSALQEISDASGARFVDLHDLLPQMGFRDEPNHLTFRGRVDGHQRVVDALVPEVLRLVDRKGRQPAASPAPAQGS